MHGQVQLSHVLCRVAAVNGALYILRQPVRKLLLDPDQQQCLGIETETGQVLHFSILPLATHWQTCLLDW